MKTADRLRKIADLADSIMEACEEIAERWAEWDDTEDMNASERAEHHTDIEETIDGAAGEIMAESAKMQALHPLYVSAEDS